MQTNAPRETVLLIGGGRLHGQKCTFPAGESLPAYVVVAQPSPSVLTYALFRLLKVTGPAGEAPVYEFVDEAPDAVVTSGKVG